MVKYKLIFIEIGFFFFYVDNITFKEDSITK